MPRCRDRREGAADESKIMKSNILHIIWLSVFCLTLHTSCVSSGSSDLIRELKSIEKTISLPYNDALTGRVQVFAARPLPETFRVHEAFIDSALQQRGIPSEIKYLPCALSGCQAGFCQGDRCGYWALPSLVAMRYGLAVEATRDERLSVEASTCAALDYLADLHEEYDDWWSCILAYANSPTSLGHALLRAEGEPELWDFHEQHLMPNTQVIADYIACVYLGNLNRLDFSMKAVEPDVVKVVEVVKPVAPPAPKPAKPSTDTTSQTIKYKIKSGDTLTKIAAQYHVSVADIMKWNQLKNDKIREGEILLIKKK